MTPEQLARSGSEDAHQTALFAWAATATREYPQLRWLHSVPNGGLRSARTGAKMKATGARKGVWDVHLPVPIYSQLPGMGGPFNAVRYRTGLYIEMKKPGTGRLTTEQKEFRAHLEFYSYETAVCFTWEEARDEILAYLKYITPEQTALYKDAIK